jgi:hypothetical protein
MDGGKMRGTPQDPGGCREVDRQWTTTKLLLRIIVILLVPLIVVLLKRYSLL